MPQFNHFKDSKLRLRVELIGRTRFIIGIVVGVLSSLILYRAVDLMKEIMRSLELWDLYMPSEQEVNYTDFLFISFAIAVGSSITLLLWLSKRFIDLSPRRKRWLQFARTIIIVNVGVWLTVLVRWSYLLALCSFWVYSVSSVHVDLNFKLFVLLFGFVMWLTNWTVLRLVFKLAWWPLVSFIACVVLYFALSLTTTDRDVLNLQHQQRHSERFSYVDSMVNLAKASYSIEYSGECIATVKEFNTHRSGHQVSAVRTSVGKNDNVALDSLFLEIMLVDMGKKNRYMHTFLESYVHPSEVYGRIKNAEPESAEFDLYLRLLQSEINCWNNHYSKKIHGRSGMDSQIVGHFYTSLGTDCSWNIPHYLQTVLKK